MKEACRIIYECGQAEIVEKKSRFIGVTFPVDSEEEALGFIEEYRKKYWDARHRCFAFVIGDNMEMQRFSDDGEPQGTAGKPILDVLLGQEIHNCLIIVIRYFGGTLLGTGGLVRAYSQAAKEALDNSEIIEKKRGVLLNIQTDYNGIGKVQYILGKRQIDIWKSDYAGEVFLQVLVPLTELDALMNEITECTAGRSRMEQEKEVFFAKCSDDVLLF